MFFEGDFTKFLFAEDATPTNETSTIARLNAFFEDDFVNQLITSFKASHRGKLESSTANLMKLDEDKSELTADSNNASEFMSRPFRYLFEQHINKSELNSNSASMTTQPIKECKE